MELKIIGTGSSGNAYLLENEQEVLLIECGVNIKDIKVALGFNLKKLVGCIVTHEHGDHAKSIKELLSAGVDVYATEGTHRACGTSNSHRARIFKSSLGEDKVYSSINIGGFSVKPFDVLHDAAEPVGFLINHEETGNVLFMTDLIYSKYTFKNLNNIIIEANYDDAMARTKLQEMEFLRNRVINNHMSLKTCRKFLHESNLSAVNNIVLIHLSDGNSNARMFQETVAKDTGKNVTIADNGLVMNINKTPF